MASSWADNLAGFTCAKTVFCFFVFFLLYAIFHLNEILKFRSDLVLKTLKYCGEDRWFDSQFGRLFLYFFKTNFLKTDKNNTRWVSMVRRPWYIHIFVVKHQSVKLCKVLCEISYVLPRHPLFLVSLFCIKNCYQKCFQMEKCFTLFHHISVQ